MKILLKPLQFLFTLWVGVTYIFFMLLVFPLFFLLYATLDEVKAHRHVMKIIRYWAAAWGFLCGFRFEVSGREKISEKECYVFVSNHVSNLDAMVWAYANRHLMKALAKKELTKIPVLGYLFKKTSVIVERGSKESRQESMKALREAAEKNISIFIFPEGTRNRGQKPLQPFYDGAFRIAIELQKPVAPLVICNTGLLMPGGSIFFRPGAVKCIFLEPIPTCGLEESDMESLKSRVFALMEKAVLENDERFRKI